MHVPLCVRNLNSARVSRARCHSRKADGFSAWVRGEGGELFGLSVSARSLVLSVLEDDFGRRARQYYLDRPEVRSLHPNGLNPAGEKGLYRWFLQQGCFEGKLSAEEVLWLFIQLSETPDQERG